jgi:hypothetical protein
VELTGTTGATFTGTPVRARERQPLPMAVQQVTGEELSGTEKRVVLSEFQH